MVFDCMMMSAPSALGAATTYSTNSSSISSLTIPNYGEVEFFLWAAAGGASALGVPGAPGGYVYAKFLVYAGDVVKYAAGQPGIGGSEGIGPKTGGQGAGSFGNGGNSGSGTDGYSHGGSGGGASAAWINDIVKAMAGGGAGSGAENSYRGGSGGGWSGGDGTDSPNGGTQSAPGGNATGMNGGTGTNNREAGAGGGGGWNGGGGGLGSAFGSGGTGAGGGSGYVAPDCLSADMKAAAFTATQPPNTSNQYYNGTAGVPVATANVAANQGWAVVVYRPYF